MINIRILQNNFYKILLIIETGERDILNLKKYGTEEHIQYKKNCCRY